MPFLSSLGEGYTLVPCHTWILDTWSSGSSSLWAGQDFYSRGWSPEGRCAPLIKVMIATPLWFWQEHLLMHTALHSALSGQGSLFLHHWQSVNTLTTPCNELHGCWVGAHIQVSIPAKVSFSRCSCLWASSVQLNLRDNEKVRKAEQKVRGHSTHCWTSWAFYNVTSILLDILFYYNCFCDRSFWCHCIFMSRRVKSAFSAVKQVKIA